MELSKFEKGCIDLIHTAPSEAGVLQCPIVKFGENQIITMKNRKLKSAVRSLQQEGTAELEKLGSGEIQILKGGINDGALREFEEVDCGSNCPHVNCGWN